MVAHPEYPRQKNSPHSSISPTVIGQNTPEAPAPGPPAPTAPGTSATADGLAFSRPCPQCRTVVTLPWCHLVSGVLDRLDGLEELPAELATLYARVGWLEDVVRALQAHNEEVRP